MPSVIEARVDATRVQVRLDALPDKLRTELRSVVGTLDRELVARVQARIPVKTGDLRDAIRGHIRSSKTRVSGTVNVAKSAKGQRCVMAQAFDVKVDSKRVQVRMDSMPDNVRTALKGVVKTLDSELLSLVKSLTPVKTGLLQNAFRGHVRSTKTRVSGSVNVDKNVKGARGIAAILEAGADVPAHEILPDVKMALAFMRSAGQVFAASVHHPADHVPAVHMLSGALDSMHAEIVAELTGTVRDATSQGQ